MSLTKLLSSDPNTLENLFVSDQFGEVVSPLVEPEAASDIAMIDRLLDDLDCLTTGTVSNSKMRVLLSSFLLQPESLAERLKRKGGELIIGWSHGETYRRVR